MTAGLGNDFRDGGNMSIVIYGQQGCGKSRNKAALAEHFCAGQVIDDWQPGDPLPNDALALTNCQGVEGAIEFHTAMGMLTTP